MPTTSLAGDRSRRSRNPRDITGTRYAQQHAEQDAKRAVASVHIDTIRAAEFQRGFDTAWEKAFEAGWNALGELLIEEDAITREALLAIVNAKDGE
jgi:hypothetical protein